MTKFVKFISFSVLNLLTFPLLTNAETGWLTPCKDSDAFQKRLVKTVKKLEFRLKKYDESSPPRLAIQHQIDLTKERFERYANSSLLCGNDGLPHLVVDGRWNHAAEFLLPSILFLYITGWIGWVGRSYLKAISANPNPTEKEIVIDIPLAIKIITKGYLWPLGAWQEVLSGELTVPDNTITRSPR